MNKAPSIVYSIDEVEIQQVAQDELGRELTNEEIYI